MLGVVRALDPPRALAGGLDGGEQESDEHSNDGDDHHQQFDEGEATRGQVVRTEGSLSLRIRPIQWDQDRVDRESHLELRLSLNKQASSIQSDGE